MTLIIVYPEVYVKSAFNGLKMFCLNVLPALLPFFFFSKLLTSLGAADGIQRFAAKPMKLLYRSPPIGAYVFGISMLSGYPVGAKLLSDLYAEGVLTEDDCKRISAFTSTGGPLFILGTAGALLGNKSACYIILLAHLLGALINGLIYRRAGKYENARLPRLSRPDADKILSEGITSAVQSVLVVGGYITIFNVVADIAANLGLTSLIAALAAPAFSLLGLKALSRPIITGLIEVTRGIMEIALSAASISAKTAAAAGLISFGGLSITLQSITFLSKCKIKPAYYLLTKSSQAVIGYILTVFLCAVFNI